MMTLNKSNTTLNTQAVLSMKSSGYYSQRTAGAKIAIDSIQPLMEKAIIEIPKLPILRMADFGSADGGTSQAMWSKLINIIRKGNDNRHIEILYTDLASNDFSTLFKTMQGMLGNTKLSFQKKFNNVFVHGCGTGFHQQLMSNESLSLGFSATAMHYVSEKPCQIKNHVHMVGADSSEKIKFEEQALKDWESILISRSKELAKGGRFICLNFGIDENGRFLGNTGGHSMFDKFLYHWKSLLNNKIITEEEYIAATFTQHYRTVSEFRKPFDDKNSKVFKSGLRLKSCRTKLTECPYKKNFLENIKTISKSEYAMNLIPTMRSWSETVFRTALVGRNEQEINKIVDRFYQSYQSEIAKDPEGHAMDYIHIIMDIEKI
tara:strand:+ start:3390 stop:4517 length:1128 start_codon:yes stop_codon:yes gene_type:complete